MFVKNVGTVDKIIRWIVGLVLGFFAYKETGMLAVVLGVAAVVVIMTALLGWCGLYALLGVNTTCNIEKSK